MIPVMSRFQISKPPPQDGAGVRASASSSKLGINSQSFFPVISALS
jgi:hypothetical protein